MVSLSSRVFFTISPGIDCATFRLRQDLQFIASRGSIVARRGISRSMLT
jgi:hypothetical protein